MQTFKYVAVDATGHNVNGLIEAFDEIDATARLRNQYSIISSLKSVNQLAVPNFLNAEIGGQKLDSKAFTLMCSQFATILSAGVPIARATKLIAAKTTDKYLKALLPQVAEDVEAGRTLSSAFEEHGKGLLPATFVETLRAGEESGSMADSFESIYRHYDKQTKIGNKVRTAMAYPLFVLVVAVVVVIFLMVKVVPTFTQIFASYDAELPAMTKALVAISGFFRKNLLAIIIAIIAIGAVYIIVKRTPRGGRFLAQTQLALPILGNIAQLNAASLFANTMATMIGSGLPMTKAVGITAKVMPNQIIKERVGGMVTRIEEGRTVVDAMREADCMPDILTDMVGVGEETGEMQHTLDITAQYYDSELEMAITKAVQMMEPALLIFIAVVAGFIVLSIYIAMFQMYSIM